LTDACHTSFINSDRYGIDVLDALLFQLNIWYTCL